MIKFLIGALIILVGYALSWAITVGILYLIFLCFSWKFNLLVATGVWLIMCLAKLLFHKGDS